MPEAATSFSLADNALQPSLENPLSNLEICCGSLHHDVLIQLCCNKSKGKVISIINNEKNISKRTQSLQIIRFQIPRNPKNCKRAATNEDDWQATEEKGWGRRRKGVANEWENRRWWLRLAKGSSVIATVRLAICNKWVTKMIRNRPLMVAAIDWLLKMRNEGFSLARIREAESYDRDSLTRYLIQPALCILEVGTLNVARNTSKKIVSDRWCKT